MFIVTVQDQESYKTAEEAEAVAEKRAMSGVPSMVAEIIGKVCATPTAFEVQKLDAEDKPIKSLASVVRADVASVLTK